MLSRVANSIYWMNRYVERAENYARFIDVNMNLMLDLPPTLTQQWKPLITATADDVAFFEHFDEASGSNVMFFMTFDSRNQNSILSSLQQARENARTIRETISKEMWEQINYLYWRVKDAAAHHHLWDSRNWREFYNDIKFGCEAFYGIIYSTITRNDGWHFGNVGRLLERADKTTRLLDVKYFTLLPDVSAVGSPLDLLQWTAVLKSVSAYNMYRQRFRNMSPGHIVEFLILEENFPRSVLHCLKRAEWSLHEITGVAPGSPGEDTAQQQLRLLREEVETQSVSSLFTSGLHQFLDEYQGRNNAVGATIFNVYFDLKPAA